MNDKYRSQLSSFAIALGICSSAASSFPQARHFNETWSRGEFAGLAGYDSGLRAHGRFRCPVNCRKLESQSTGSGSSEFIPGDVPKRRTRLLNKTDGKNRESENPEEISLLSGRNPTVMLGHRGERFETENRQRGERGGPSVCEYGRNDKTPKELSHGVWR